MTYFGSGICSYSRLIAGAILSVTVPDTTIRSACRGPGANGITPSRMKSCRPIDAAMNSIAQQARPKLNTHSEYLRPQFSRYRTGSGASLASAPTAGGRTVGVGRWTVLSWLATIDSLVLHSAEERGREAPHASAFRARGAAVTPHHEPGRADLA